MAASITEILSASVAVKKRLLEDKTLLARVQQVTDHLIRSFQSGHRVWFCGNGGSAADAQHLAAEFSGRFYVDRPPLPSEALHANTSYLTAVANDYGYEFVYSRLLKGSAEKGDILVGLSTSGNSKNIVKAFEAARSMGVTTVGMTGASGGAIKTLADYLINIPSEDTPRIQECHITVGHVMCQLTEEALFG